MAQGEVAKLYIAGHKGYGAGGFPAWGYPVITVIIRLIKYFNSLVQCVKRAMARCLPSDELYVDKYIPQLFTKFALPSH